MSYGNNLFPQRSLLAETFAFLVLLCVTFDVVMGATCAEFNIHAAHYAPKGYSRLGSTGYGEFLDYSFGRTSACNNTVFYQSCEHDKSWRTTNSIIPQNNFFDSATLCYDANSCRLFKIIASRTFQPGMSSADYIELLKAISRDCDYRYGIIIPIPSSAEIDGLVKERHNTWSINRGDSSFLISLSLSLKANGVMQLTMTVESLQVRRHSEAHGGINDIGVDVGDL